MDKMEGITYEMMDFMDLKLFVDPDTAGLSKVKESAGKDDVKLVQVSATDSDGLTAALKNLPNLKSVSNRKSTSEFRQAILYRTKTDLSETIEEILEASKVSRKPISVSQKPKICFLITCQGTHYPAMGKRLYSVSSIFRQHFDYCAVHVAKEYKIDIKSFLEGAVVPNVVPDWMESPINFLPYLLALQYALFKVWEDWGIKPDYVLGLSFGEYGAAVFAEMITIEEAFKLIMTRIILMTKNIKEEGFCVAQMDTVKYNEIMEECKVDLEDMWLDISGVNSPKQTCLVGHLKYINKFSETCKKHGIKNLVKEYHPYHSSLTKPIIPAFLQTTSTIAYSPAKAKFISTVDGKLWDTLNPTYFLDHLTGPVIAIGAVETALAEGVTHFLEVGPHPILIQMVKDIIQNNDPQAASKFTFVTSLTRKEDDDRVALLNSVGRLYMAGFDVNWENVDKFQAQS